MPDILALKSEATMQPRLAGQTSVKVVAANAATTDAAAVAATVALTGVGAWGCWRWQWVH